MFEYLQPSLLNSQEGIQQLQTHAGGAAIALRQGGVAPVWMESFTEWLARLAELSTDESMCAAALAKACAWLAPEPAILDLIEQVAQTPLERLQLAALAIHLLDVTEQMAVQVYVPELPNLFAKSDRSGDAARSVGRARHLRG